MMLWYWKSWMLCTVSGNLKKNVRSKRQPAQLICPHKYLVFAVFVLQQEEKNKILLKHSLLCVS